MSKIKLLQLAAPEVWIVSGVANSYTDKTQSWKKKSLRKYFIDLRGEKNFKPSISFF